MATVKALAYSLNISERTIQRHAEALGLTSNGKITYLDLAAATAIKQRVERSGRNDLANVVEVSNATTALEIEEMTVKVINYHRAQVEQLRAELDAARPAIESHAALMRTDRTMSITDAAKHFGLHPKTEVFPYLREHGYLTRKDIPTEAAISAGYLALKETACIDGIARPQAVIEARMLETWRTRVVPQIAKWIKEGAA